MMENKLNSPIVIELVGGPLDGETAEYRNVCRQMPAHQYLWRDNGDLEGFYAMSWKCDPETGNVVYVGSWVAA